MTYAIEFATPEGISYAGDYQGAAGFAPSLATAYTFTSADVAQRMLLNAYGEAMRQWGRVIEIGKVA